MNSVTTRYVPYYIRTGNKEVAFLLFLLYFIILIIWVYTMPTQIHLILGLSVCISVRIQFFSEPIPYASSLSTSMAVPQANKEMLLNLVVCLNGAAFKKVPKQFFRFKHWGTLIIWCRFQTFNDSDERIKWQRGLRATNDSPFLLVDTHSCLAAQTAGVDLWEKLSGFCLIITAEENLCSDSFGGKRL